MSKWKTFKNKTKRVVLECGYSPVSRHENCPNKRDCIFSNEDLWEYANPELMETVALINDVKRVIKEYRNVLDAYLNGEIVYHDGLGDYYDIRIIHTDKGVHTCVSVPSNFSSVVRDGIRMLELDLREYNRVLFRLKREL